MWTLTISVLAIAILQKSDCQEDTPALTEAVPPPTTTTTDVPTTTEKITTKKRVVPYNLPFVADPNTITCVKNLRGNYHINNTMCVKPFDADCKKTMQFLNCAKIAIKRECGENGVKSFLAQFSAFFNPSLPVLLFDATKPDCINIGHLINEELPDAVVIPTPPVLTAITNETSAVDNDITEVPDLSSDEPEDPEETDEHSGTSYQLAVKKILLVFGFAIIFNNLLA